MRSLLEPNEISYSAAMSACEKGQQWEQVEDTAGNPFDPDPYLRQCPNSPL